VGLIVATLVVAGGIALAGGFGQGTPVSTESCPAASNETPCDQGINGEGAFDCEGPEWSCPADESECVDGAAVCNRLSTTRSCAGSGTYAGTGGGPERGYGRAFGGCRSGRF